MTRNYAQDLRIPGVPQQPRRWRVNWLAVAALALACSPVTIVPGASAGEESTPPSERGDFMICVREQNLLGDYGPERCVSHASLISGVGGSGFGPAAYWVGEGRKPSNTTTAYRLNNTYIRPEFRAMDIEETARTHAPAAIWMLSYNIKELATTFREAEQNWPLMRLDGHQTIGLSALDPGIERNPTGLKAFGLRISLPY